MTASLNGAVVIVPSSELGLYQVCKVTTTTILYSNIVDTRSGIVGFATSPTTAIKNTVLMILKKCYRDVRWRLM